MKALILLFSSVFMSSCVTSGVKTRAVASEEECNIENYRDFIYRPGVHKCDLRRVAFRDKSFSSLFGLIDAPANLSGVNFEGADLTEVDLQGADLTWANLHRAILPDADLRGADLEDADLSYANLFSADLSYANLYKTNLKGANLSYANLYKTNLKLATLKTANLENAKVTKKQAEYLTAKGLSGFVVVE